MTIILSLVIPLYNEEKCAEKVLRDLTGVFNKNNAKYEIIIVDNGSTDNTNTIIKKIVKKNKNLKLVCLPINKDYGGGIITGMKAASGKILGFTAGDGEISTDDTYKIFRSFCNGNEDICKAKRVSRKDGFKRKLFSRMYNFLVSCIFAINLKDVNGYPVFMKYDVYKKINPDVKNWIFNLDIYNKAKSLNYTIKEIPVLHKKRLGGRSHLKLTKVFDMFIELIKYRLGSVERFAYKPKFILKNERN